MSVVDDCEKVPGKDGRDELIRLLKAGNFSPESFTLRSLDLSDTDLTAATLRLADLSQAQLDRVTLVGADMAGAILQGATLREANLQNTLLEDANLEGADLRFADLRESTLDSANLKSADLWGANLENAALMSSNLRNATLNEAHLRGADLSGANLTNASLAKAYLRTANLSRATLTGAQLQGADLCNAILAGANLEDVNLSSCNLHRIFLAKAHMNRTQLSLEQLGGMLGEEANGDYEGAKQGYLALERNFSSLGDKDSATWAYLRRRRMEKWSCWRRAGNSFRCRQLLQTFKWLSQFWADQLVEWLCDYGESVLRVLGSLVVVYLTFVWLYKLTGSVVHFQLGPDGEVENGPGTFSDLFIFSLQAMTTSGSPTVNLPPSVNILAGLQALIGIALTGLLGFVAGNRIRR